LSVRAAEFLCNNRTGPSQVSASVKKEKRKLPEVADLEDRLIQTLGTKVSIRHKGKKGKIEIEYYSLDELDRLLELFFGK
jgi:ParB family chromosome partitioning protein